MSSEVVALLLGEEMPPERLGQLLRDGRKRRGWKRKQAAAMVRITRDDLRDYERGRAPIPPDVCARLAECYGTDLTAHVPLRVDARVESEALVVGAQRTAVDAQDLDAVVKSYVELLRRVRAGRSGDALPLRAADLAALGAAFDADPPEIEERIAKALGCTREEARALHRELLRRRVVVPVAGLAAGVAALAGVQAAHASNHVGDAPGAPNPPAVEAHGPVVAAPTTTIALTTPTTLAMTQKPAPAPAVHVVVQHPKKSTVASPATHALSPPATTDDNATPPSIPYDDTWAGVMPGEKPYTPGDPPPTP